LAEDTISSAERRAASESLGVLARLGSDTYAARLVCVLMLIETDFELYVGSKHILFRCSGCCDGLVTYL
jgi:hypothetical protein